jgi:hypothetical protein
MNGYVFKSFYVQVQGRAVLVVSNCNYVVNY